MPHSFYDRDSCLPHNTPRTRFSQIGLNLPPKPDRTVRLEIRGTFVKMEHYEELPGLEEVNIERDASELDAMRRSVYFSNLPRSLPRNFIEDFFSVFGEWEAIELHTSDTRPTYWGFIRFETASSANYMVKNEITIYATHKGSVLGFGFWKCLHLIKDGFHVIEASSAFRPSSPNPQRKSLGTEHQQDGASPIPSLYKSLQELGI